MGTRATLTIAGQQESYSIYQHYDGYPDTEVGIVAKLAQARRLAAVDRGGNFTDAADFAAAMIATLKVVPTMLDRGLTTYLATGANSYDRAYHYALSSKPENPQLRVLSSWYDQHDMEILRTVFEGTIDEAIKHFRIDVSKIDTSLVDFLAAQNKPQDK